MLSDKRTNDLIEMVQKTKVLGLLPYAFTFAQCNNNCDFCCLKSIHDNKLMSLEEFKKIGEYEIQWLNENIDKLPEGTLLKHYFIGGEIGVLPKEYFNYFYKLFDSLHEMTTNKPVKLHNTLFSNLILEKEKLNRLFNLFDYISQKNKLVTIATSYDIHGRFKNDLSLKIWQNNLEKVLTKEDDLLIETILTKSSMKRYVEDKNNNSVILFDRLLEMDKTKQLSVVFNEYQPYNSNSMSEVPTFDDYHNFYNEIKNRHGIDLNIFMPHNLGVKINKDDFKSYCETVEFIPMFDREESPCELIPYIFWPKHDDIKKENIIKNKLNGEFTCLKHHECVETFFNKRYKCNLCKYKPWCSERNLRGCYQSHQFIWKPKECINKMLFEMVNDE